MSQIDRFFDSVSAVFSDFAGNHQRAKLLRGELDQSPYGSDVIEREEWPRRLRPRGSDYRVVRYQDGRLGLQSKQGDVWVDVTQYEDGFDDDGRLYAARWRQMSECCMWREQGLRLLREKLLGTVRAPEVLDAELGS